uniref:PPC domain-containing protein n=1 Tax=Strongyloides papillosus TaxID=174720 RepID=A0A0N5C6B6_STREA
MEKPVDIIPSGIVATIDGAYVDDICGILTQRHENFCKSKKIDLDSNVSLRLSADSGGDTTKITMSFIEVKGSDSGNSGSLILCYKGSDSTFILRKSFGYVESQLQNLRVINEDL